MEQVQPRSVEPLAPAWVRSVCVLLGAVALPATCVVSAFGVVLSPEIYISSGLVSGHSISVAFGRKGLIESLRGIRAG